MASLKFIALSLVIMLLIVGVTCEEDNQKIDDNYLAEKLGNRARRTYKKRPGKKHGSDSSDSSIEED